MAPKNVLVELFADFIRLRQVGYAPDAAWQALRPQVVKLDETDIARLHTLLRGWEAREGRYYQVAGALNGTPEQPDERMERVRTSMTAQTDQAETARENAARENAAQSDDEAIGLMQPKRPPSLDAGPEEGYAHKRHLIRRLATPPEPATPTDAVGDGVCPVCFRANRPGDVYCVHCGYMLAGPTDDAAGYPGAVQGAPFCDGMVIQVKVRGSNEVIRVVPSPNKTLLMGRSSSESVTMPDVDLTPFSAQSFGVSRLHAGLTWQGTSILLHDLGSLNYTFLNGQRLHTHEQRAVHDGDEIRLGHLVMHVYFRHEG